VSDAEPVRLAVDGGIATITLDSPHNRNALSSQLVTELTDRLRAADGNAAAHAVVLTHTGKTFCSGADLSEARTGSMSETAARLLTLIRAIIDLGKPVIARIDGNARAGGVGLIGACDIAVAGPGCSFALTEVRLGLAPAVVSLALLSRIDARAAARYYLTGESFDGTEALRIGLVTIAAADADEAVAAVAAQLLLGSPQGLAESKRLTTAPVRAAIDRDGDRMVELSARLFASEEAHEGMVAFLERRPPRWVH
jgi:enoyl-CoA hydratase/carnithine racemase